MRPGFQRDPTARHRSEDSAESFRSDADPLLQLDLAAFLQHAVPKAVVCQPYASAPPLARLSAQTTLTTPGNVVALLDGGGDRKRSQTSRSALSHAALIEVCVA